MATAVRSWTSLDFDHAGELRTVEVTITFESAQFVTTLATGGQDDVWVLATGTTEDMAPGLVRHRRTFVAQGRPTRLTVTFNHPVCVTGWLVTYR